MNTPLYRQLNDKHIENHLFYLAKEPLPCRIFNYTRPGSTICTLYEADAYIRQQLSQYGYVPVDECVPVQSFVPDSTVPHGFRKPLQNEPWHEACNIYARKTGNSRPDRIILLLAHKDSQSWLPCAAGAYDNAIGVAVTLELARLFADYPCRNSIWFLFCNEEHWPWTSVTAAKEMAAQHRPVVAVINIDSIGATSPKAPPGQMTQVTRFSTPQGKQLAQLIDEINNREKIGLYHHTYYLETPNDDDGSFINAGISSAVLAIGNYPYDNPFYHSLEDTADKVDLQNATLSAGLIAATVQYLDQNGASESTNGKRF